MKYVLPIDHDLVLRDLLQAQADLIADSADAVRGDTMAALGHLADNGGASKRVVAKKGRLNAGIVYAVPGQMVLWAFFIIDDKQDLVVVQLSTQPTTTAIPLLRSPPEELWRRARERLKRYNR